MGNRNEAVNNARNQPNTSPSASTAQCPQTCTITSQTIATSPANRARTRIGVGEEVELTVSPGPATWSVSGGGTLSSTSGTTVTFTAGDRTATSTITATGSGCSCTITFTIVEPSSWTMTRRSGTNLRHTNGRPDCGWLGIMDVHPNNVNFYRVETRELNSQFTGNGSYSGFTGAWHQPASQTESVFFPITSHSDSDGSRVAMNDNIYTGDPGSAATGMAPPFTPGSGHFPITWQWRVVGTGNIHDFPVVRQEAKIFANGRCESRKGGHTEFTLHNDPTSTP